MAASTLHLNADVLPYTQGSLAGEPSRSKGTGFARRAVAADLMMLAITVLVLSVASPTSSFSGNIPSTPPVWLLVMSASVLGIFYLRGMYLPPLHLELLEVLRTVVAGTAVAVTVAMATRVTLVDDTWVAAETVRFWILALPLLAGGRCALLWHEARARREGHASRRTLIVGGGRVGTLAAERLLDDPELGLRPVAFLDDDPLDVDAAPGGLPILSDHGDFESLARRMRIDHVIIAFSRASHEQLLGLARDCWRLGITVSVVPRLFEIQGQRAFTEHLGGLPLMEMRAANPRGWQFRLKYAVDRIVAAIALVVLTPVLLTITAVVLLRMGRPVLYRQRRVGRDGHVFDMLKFRTMRLETMGEADADWAEEQLGGEISVVHTPLEDRLTPVGRFLRRTSLDELPQLWNVLSGDMSLIGPRPERASYVEQFEKGLYRYSERHRVKSGLTGWAQVHGLRGKTSLRDRTEWDNHYIENWSLWLDLKIVCMTLASLGRAHSE
jgi:exopolysaccharide biosynthesis polyprenyl glycosylphosphotransferase